MCVGSGSTREARVKVKGPLGGSDRPFRWLLPCDWSKSLSPGASAP